MALIMFYEVEQFKLWSVMYTDRRKKDQGSFTPIEQGFQVTYKTFTRPTYHLPH